MSFLTSIKQGNPDEEAHRQLLRFSAGEFEREKIKVKLGSSVEVGAGFEYLGALQDLFIECSEADIIKVSGQVIGKDKKAIQEILEEYHIEPVKVFGTKVTVSFEMKKQEVQKLKNELEEKKGYFLCGLSAGKETLKAKTTFPKAGKLVENFCKLKLGKGAKDKVLEELGLGNIDKRAEIETTYVIHDVKVDSELLKSDPARARLESKRDVTVKRKITADGNETNEEFRALV